MTTPADHNEAVLKETLQPEPGKAAQPRPRTSRAVFRLAQDGLEVLGFDKGPADEPRAPDCHTLDIYLDGQMALHADPRHKATPMAARSFTLRPAGATQPHSAARNGRTLRLSFSDAVGAKSGLTADMLREAIQCKVDPALVGAATIAFEHWAHSDTPVPSDELRALSTTILARLARLLVDTPVAPKSTSPIDRALRYIEDNLAMPLPVSDVAQQAGCSPYHFCRIFRAATDQSPHRYITIRRVAAAKRLIETSHNSLAEIAFQTGFGSQSHMTTTFKRLANVTPGEVRRQTVS